MPSALKKASSENYFNKAEDKEDKERIERQQAVNTLFGMLGLVPTISNTISQKQSIKTAPSSQAVVSTRDLPEVHNTDLAGKIDLTEEGAIAQDKIDLVYQKAATNDMYLDMKSPCQGFRLQLRPYQKQGLGWLIKMESKLEDAREDVSIHPLWEEYLFPQEEPENKDNCVATSGDHAFGAPEEKFYYNPYMGELSLTFPRASHKCQGGILADEMGLGKTIQMAALICTARPSGHSFMSSDPQTMSDEALVDATENVTDVPDDEMEKSDDVVYVPSPKKKHRLDTTNKTKPIISSVVSGRISHATLVICPLTLLDQWKDELERCHKDLRVHIYHPGSKAECDVLNSDADVVISTYGIIGNEWTNFEKSVNNRNSRTRSIFDMEWYRIILDEGHNIKNRSTRASKACFQLKGQRRWVLTGTPIVNRLEDLASLLHFIKLEPWGNFSFYRSFVTIPFSKKDPKALVVVQTIIESVLLRREKKMKDSDGNSIVDLPPKHVQIEYLDLNPKERKIYDMVYRNAKSEFLAYLGKGTVLNNVTAILAILMRLRQAVLHPMLVLDKLQVMKSSSKMNEDGTSDEDIIGQMLKEYKGGGQESFAATQMKALEKKLKGDEDAGQALEQECTLCLDFIDSRVYLPCMHSFCKTCIMTYVESKDGAETVCPSCEIPFRETEIVEYVVSQSRKTNSQASSSVPSTPEASASDLTDEATLNQEAKPNIQSQSIGSSSLYDTSILNEELPNDATLEPPKGSNAAMPSGGYLKRNDFVSSTKLEALILHLIKARSEDPGFSAVVFSQFTGFLNLIEIVLKRDKFRFVRLDGSLSNSKRKKALAEFNEPNQPCILVCSLKVAGVGLNLIKANRVYLMDTWWNEAIEDQAIDRIHRYGQTKRTYVVRFLVSKSIENRMLALQKKKRAIVNDALGGSGDKSKAKARTLEDLENIFAD